MTYDHAMRKELLEDDFLDSFNAGLELAAQLAESWADQCCGGSGEGGEGYRNLAKAIRSKQKVFAPKVKRQI